MAVHGHVHRPAPDTTPTDSASDTPAAPAPATPAAGPAAPTVAPAPDAATLAAWAALGPALSDHACILADRDDILVTVRPEGTSSGAPAQFTPATATVDLDANIFPIPPASIRPHHTGDAHRYPAAYGALTTRPPTPSTLGGNRRPTTPSAVVHAAELLDESRIEAKHTARRPADRTFLRACALDLVLDEITLTPADGPYAAATAAALILGRESAGILTPAETAPVRAAAESILGRRHWPSWRRSGAPPTSSTTRTPPDSWNWPPPGPPPCTRPLASTRNPRVRRPPHPAAMASRRRRSPGRWLPRSPPPHAPSLARSPRRTPSRPTTRPTRPRRPPRRCSAGGTARADAHAVDPLPVPARPPQRKPPLLGHWPARCAPPPTANASPPPPPANCPPAD